MALRVLILGATSGIAQETSRCFARAGAQLFLVARDEEKLAAMAEDLKVRGAKSIGTFQADLTRYATHPEIVARTHSFLGGIDAALIAHGVLPDQRSAENDMEVLKSAMETNYLSSVLVLMRLADYFEKQQSGILAIIGSVAGDRGRRSNYVYGSTKAAIATFVSGLRLRLAAAGVQVVLIKPGPVSTPMTAHLRQSLLFISAEKAGRGVYDAMCSPRPIVYLPWYWKWIMRGVRSLPESFFARISNL